MGKVDPVAAVASSQQSRRPLLVVALGRGGRGKSVMLRWLAETSPRHRPLRILDADPSLAALSRYFPEALTVPPGDEDARLSWLEGQIEQAVEAHEDVLLDVGHNDPLMKRLGKEAALVQSLEEVGVDLVAIHMLGPDLDDLKYLEEVEGKGLLQPKHTVLVLNQGLTPMTGDTVAAFSNVLASDVVKALRSDKREDHRQVRLVVMPCLPCMREVEAKKLPSFASALTPEGGRAIGPLFNRGRVRRWLNTEMVEFRASLADVLP